jgi:D-ribose pyranase
MKRIGILNSRISAVVAGMGHTDTIAIVDAGFPIPASVERIDLALKPGLPNLSEVLESLLSELCVEEVTIASEMRSKNPGLYSKLVEDFHDVRLLEVSHEELKLRSASCKAIIRTGECKAYANILLRSGVTF